jgi:hypothetical protein
VRDPITIIRWENLPLDQQRVLTSAMEDMTLNWVYRDWAANEDLSFNHGQNNRGRLYAEALIPAAVELVRRGIVGVVTADPDLRVLPQNDAVAALEDINNWWRYEVFEDANDPLDPGLDPSGLLAEPDWRSAYALTQINRDRFTISSWNPPPPMERLLP